MGFTFLNIGMYGGEGVCVWLALHFCSTMELSGLDQNLWAVFPKVISLIKRLPRKVEPFFISEYLSVTIIGKKVS